MQRQLLIGTCCALALPQRHCRRSAARAPRLHALPAGQACCTRSGTVLAAALSLTRTIGDSRPCQTGGSARGGACTRARRGALCAAALHATANSMDAPGSPAEAHVLVTCHSLDDRSRLEAVASQIHQRSRELGSPLVLHFDHAAMPLGAAPAFSAADCMAQLTSQRLGRILLTAAEVGSTQDVIRSHGPTLGEGVVLVADRQTAGKGRGGNQWTSPDGCLMFTAARRVRVRSPAQAPFINYLVCLAVTRGIRQAVSTRLKGVPPIDVRIKWPNDIYTSDGLKIGGALIHTSWQQDRFNVVTGIGLNVSNRQPTTCIDALVEQACAGHGVPAPAVSAGREAVLASVLANLEQIFQVFEQEGFAPLQDEYLATWLHSGQRLGFEATRADGATVRQQLLVLGLSPSGFLLAEDVDDGSKYELTPDGNSLDMMQGLIRRKIL